MMRQPIREGVRDLAVWCQDNYLSLNISKTKDLTVANWKGRPEHASIHINGAAVERFESFEFLSIHITKDQS
jgi:hypothetical protein